MKRPQSLGRLLTVALAVAPLASAWPGWLPEIDSLVVRQDDSDSTTTADTKATATTTDEPTSTGTSAESTGTKDSDSTTTADSHEPQTTNLNTGGITSSGTGTKTQTGSKTKSGSSDAKSTTFDAEDPAGGVAMITPATTAGTTLYRIDNPDPITWVWNYTSLQGTPTAIDVMVSCSVASATWTLTQNMTFEPTATYKWDSAKYQESAVASPLVVAQYTLLIIDSDSSVSATAEAGYLAPYSGFQFGLYTSRPYEDLGEWKCATCSAANGDLDRKAVGFAVSMSIITVLSFTWYVMGFAALL
ncbi:Uu.00g001860.m01.CDS01 [Anthostomella pinea]|uniref:Uu.00g001860.m01.CDS01 n=1 Tax=Anthostomella pinea TaxID=933095 RepID=A0AAI8VK63_9PEZI|nr:Uu.00g001860.m01.CDS01 [Anthostomella pinea]